MFFEELKFILFRLTSESNGGSIFIATESSNFFSDPTYKRIILYKTKDDLDIKSTSCINGTSVPYTSL